MIRGRLVAINGRSVGPETFAGERAARLVAREFNLSHSARQPAHNEIVAGRWQDDEAGGLSVEDGLAGELGLKLGDTLRFDIGEGLLELGLVLCSLYFLARKSFFPIFGVLSAIAGTAMGIWGYLL